MAGQKSENFRHAGLVRRLGQFRREQFKLGMARRRKLDPELAAFQSRRHGHANLGVKLQLLNFRANRIFGLSQPGKPEAANLLFDPFEPVSAAKARVGGAVIDRLTGQDRVNSPSIAERNFFQPIHQIAQVILADLERESEARQRARIIRLPVKPALQRLRVKAFRRRVIANLLLRHVAPV